MMANRPFVVIGNPENRRVRFFQEALARSGHDPARVLPYRDLLSGACSIEDAPAGAIVRIDSPGEDFEVEKQLLIAGKAAAEEEGSPTISSREVAALPDDPGRILHPRQWYLGFRGALREWRRRLADRQDVSFTSWPPDIESMFDKTACHATCRRAAVPVPESLGPVACFDELIAAMESTGMSRVFVKLAHSSSASGVVALHYRRDRMAATTSAETVIAPGGEFRLYNSLKIRRYTNPDEIRPLIDYLAAHRVHVERWLPKASFDRRVCDVRVVVIAGRPRHLVVRTSRGPLTNLHLGNRRGDAERFVAKLGADRQKVFHNTCERVARLFPRTLHLGLDILFTPGFRRHALLEVNAFGDLLPGVQFEGKNTYEAQLEAILARSACEAP